MNGGGTAAAVPPNWLRRLLTSDVDADDEENSEETV